MIQVLKKYSFVFLAISFFVASGFLTFFLQRTCIRFIDVLELFLFSTALSFAAFYFIAKKYKLFVYTDFNYLILLIVVPFVMSLFLAANFYVSEPVFIGQAPTVSNLSYSKKNGYYILYKNSSQYCDKLHKIQDGVALRGSSRIETQINKGYFGYFVLYHQKAY